jgi:hypothetical protein
MTRPSANAAAARAAGPPRNDQAGGQLVIGRHDLSKVILRRQRLQLAVAIEIKRQAHDAELACGDPGAVPVAALVASQAMHEENAGQLCFWRQPRHATARCEDGPEQALVPRLDDHALDALDALQMRTATGHSRAPSRPCSA